MESLSSCLSSHAACVGNECENLGKAKRKGLFKTKVLLSYDLDNGWTCKKLNFFKLFVRKAFGYYQSTHLERVIRGFNRSAAKNCIYDSALDQDSQVLIPKFDHRIHAIWSKKRQKPFPKEVFFTKNGSVIQTYFEARNLSKHAMHQYNNMSRLIAEKKELSTEEVANLEREVKAFTEDLSEFLTFFISDVETRKKTIQSHTELISENFAKLKEKEIEPPVFQYLILRIIQTSMEKKKNP
jgi:hypothetical protein